MIDLIKKFTDINFEYDSISLKHYSTCPFCLSTVPTFSVDNKKATYFCYSCGAHGDRKTFLDRVGVSNNIIVASPKDPVLMEIHEEAAVYYYEQLTEKDNPGATYLRNRGILDAAFMTYGLGYAPGKFCNLYRIMIKKYKHDDLIRSGLFRMSQQNHPYDFFRNRVMFPILDESGNVIAFGGRVIDDSKPKYLNSPETPIYSKRQYLYGFPYGNISRNTLILCEGYMDYIAIHQSGWGDCAATLGTAITPEHARLIKAYYSKVCLAMDSDGPGIQAAKRSLNILKDAGISVTVADFNPHKDPDQFILNEHGAEFIKRIEHAVPDTIFRARNISNMDELINILMQQV